MSKQTGQDLDSKTRGIDEEPASWAELLLEAPIAIIIHDIDGKPLHFNRRWAKIHGYEPEEMSCLSLADVSTPSSKELILGRTRKVVEHGEASFEVEHHRKDGSVVALNVISKPVEWKGQQALLSIAVDISARKATERLLEAERKQLLSIFDSIDQAIYVSDTETYDILYVNKTFRDLLGYDPIGRKCFREFQGLDSPCKFCTNSTILELKGKTHSWEHHNEALGRSYWLIDRIIQWPDGRDVRFEIAFDISAIKTTEQALARKLELEAITAQASARFLTRSHLKESIDAVLGEMGTFCRASRAHLFLLERDTGTLAHFSEWCAPGVTARKYDLEKLDSKSFSWFRRQLNTGESLVVEDIADLPPEASEERSFLEAQGVASMILMPIFLKEELSGFVAFESMDKKCSWREVEGVPLRTICQIIATVLERERAEDERLKLAQQLAASQRMEAIGILAGGIAHDFNNLLTVINNYATLAMRQLPEQGRARNDIFQIQNAGNRAAALTRQLLAFSRNQVLQPKVISLNAVISDLEDLLRRLLGEDIDIEVHLDSDLGHVRADPSQMEQIVINLAVNAREAMPTGGKLTVETLNVELDEDYCQRHVSVTPGEYVMLSVSDTGIGMKPSIMNRIFEPFFTTKERGKGTGLGLATVYGIVKQSNGDIWVYSEPDSGTTFKVYLPRVSFPLSEPIPRPAHDDARGAETILIVEDEEHVRIIAERVLRSAGYKVLTAASPTEALALLGRLEDGDVNLLLTDVVMPKMSGRQLADELVKTHASLKVLFMSGYTDNAIVHHGVLDSSTNFIAKPFSVNELTRKIREVLDL